ncbi:MAG: exodeoxyribonuclease VII small subunit [Firmicutes bacterium]|nr:exodeoxyribonuclease VII small subunit [Bacillota bacterium]
MTVEQMLDRLQAITDQMETGQLQLSQMMELYKEGKSLEKKIREMLDLTEKEIEMLNTGFDQDSENGMNSIPEENEYDNI